MKSKDFIRDSALDDMVAQERQPKTTPPKTPYNQSGLGNWIGGQVGKNSPPPTTLGGKLAQGTANAISPTNVVNKIGSLAGGLNTALQAGAKSGLGGVSVGYRDPSKQQAPADAGEAPEGNQPVDTEQVEAYLKQTADRQPLKQSTGNANIDQLLKNAGLLK
jgi:hypothetical protein